MEEKGPLYQNKSLEKTAELKWEKRRDMSFYAT